MPSVRNPGYLPSMEMLTGDQIAEANLTDWRKLEQGLHDRYVVGDFGAGARFVGAVGEAGGIAAAVAVGGVVLDDSQTPSYTVIADQDGNKACVSTTLPPAQA
jgi:4a-hydroxytetrahydrobiopterin dehydratase